MLSLLLLASETLANGLTPYDYQYLASNPQPLSCSAAASSADGCAVPQSGLMLSTQFWSTYTNTDSKLPARAWTSHGLWPDYCNGSYPAYCDASRNISGEALVSNLMNFGREDLLKIGNKYWINQGAPNSDLWAHEYAKHATCTSTFDTRCYRDFKNGTDVVDYFETVLLYFTRFPTFQILERAGITPSNTTTYTLAQLQDAARNYTGADIYWGCNYAPGTRNRTILSEAWYYFNVYGQAQSGHIRMLNGSSIYNSSCQATNITFPLRANGTEIDPVTNQNSN
ncbi:hypothetical protein PYCC9005_001249 [Savitreella phatthalungensis]